MLVSVVVAALNEEKYIAKVLETAFAQKTRHQIEVIVGDGYSEDNTVKIARGLGAKVVKERNRSAAWERQAGANAAKGEIIIFTDADAALPQDWVEKIASEFENDKNLAMLYGPVYFSDAGMLDDLLSRIAMPFFQGLTSFFGIHNVIGSNLAVRRKRFLECGGFNTSLRTCEDIDLAKRISALGGTKYFPAAHIFVSARRLKKWGYPRFVIYHIANGLRFHFTGRAEKTYEDVR